MKDYSLIEIVKDLGYGDLICTSFEEAENNNRKKNIVIIDDTEIYLTYKFNGDFGEFTSWTSDEYDSPEDIQECGIPYWIEEIYSMDEADIDEAVLHIDFHFEFSKY